MKTNVVHVVAIFIILLSGWGGGSVSARMSGNGVLHDSSSIMRGAWLPAACGLGEWHLVLPALVFDYSVE